MRLKLQIHILLVVLIVVNFPFVANAAPNAKGVTINGNTRRLINDAERISGDRFRITMRTPAGVRVFAVNPPSREVLRAIDNGLSNLFAIARRNNYRRRLRPSDYTIFIARADRTTTQAGAYSPDIAVGASQYAGTKYDAGGFIYAAGMVLDTEDCAFIIAEHARDLSRISDVVRYEGEHLVLYHNDRARFAATADHSRGGGHPILK